MKGFWKAVKFTAAAAGVALFIVASPVSTKNVQAAAVQGIDVSQYQGTINWQAVAASGVKFAMVRIGNTKYGLDSNFAVNVAGATAAGIRVGAYVYSYAMNETQAAADAQLAVQAMANLPVSFPVAIDLEDPSQANLSTAQQQAIVNTFCSTIYAAGYQPMVYSYRNWFQTKLGATMWDHWVADYNSSCGFQPAAMWQYSSNGSVSGIASNVDVDYLLKDYFTSIPANGLSTQNGATYYYVNYRKQFGLQTIGGLNFFFDTTGAMVKDKTVTDTAGNITRYCKDGHVVTITVAMQQQAAQAKAAYDKAVAVQAQAEADAKTAAATSQSLAAQYSQAKAAADQLVQQAAQAALAAQQVPTQDNLTVAATLQQQAETAQKQVVTLQQQATTAAADAANKETVAKTRAAETVNYKAVNDAAQAAIVIPQ